MRGAPPSIAALALFLGCTGDTGEAVEPERPDVVLITIDTLRPDHLGFAGNERETAPFLAELASRGTVFDRAFSTSSWTAPATASLFTGLYPTRHGVVLGFFAQFVDETGGTGEAESLSLLQLPRELPTLPEVFRDAGYRTFGLAANLNIGREIGFDRGFDRFEKLHDVPAAEILEQLEAWKPEITAADPLFLYLHFNDPHAPYAEHAPWYEPSEDYRERTVSAYDSEISYLDGILRKLFEDYGIGEDAIVAVVSDHGEEFLEHGRWAHGFQLFRELTQVLFLVHAPELGVPARRTRANVSLIDVLPTLTELAGIENAPSRNGRSLAPLLRDGPLDRRFLDRLEDRPLYAHRLHRFQGKELEIWAVMRGGWKLLEMGEKRLLFDLNGDRFDQRPVPHQAQPQVVAALGRLLDEFKARGTDVHGSGRVIEIDEELRARLRKLGYVGEEGDGD